VFPSGGRRIAVIEAEVMGANDAGGTLPSGCVSGGVIRCEFRFPPTDSCSGSPRQSKAAADVGRKRRPHEICVRKVDLPQVRIDQDSGNLNGAELRDLLRGHAPPVAETHGRRGPSPVDCGRGFVHWNTGKGASRIRGPAGRGCPTTPTRGRGVEARRGESRTGSLRPESGMLHGTRSEKLEVLVLRSRQRHGRRSGWDRAMPALRRKNEHPTQSGLPVFVFDASP
jgi:hypothetical protein